MNMLSSSTGVIRKPSNGARSIQSFFHPKVSTASPLPVKNKASLPPTPALETRVLSPEPAPKRANVQTQQHQSQVPRNRERDTPLYRFREHDPVFIYFDTETTGLLRNRDQVIEIAAQVDTHQLELLCEQTPACRVLPASFETLIRPSVEVSEGARRVHHISDKMLESQQNFQEVYPVFLQWLEAWRDVSRRDILLVAYFASFDIEMLTEEQRRAHGPQAAVMPLERVRFACLLEAVRDLHHVHCNQKLHQVLKRFGALETVVAQEHRALSDCKLAMRLVHIMPDNELIYRELAHSAF